MKKVLNLKNWSYVGSICLYHTSQVERTTGELKLHSAGIIKIHHESDKLSLIIPVVFNECVGKYNDAFETPPSFDIRNDSHIILDGESGNNIYKIEKSSYYAVKSIFTYLSKDTIVNIKKNFQWEQKQDFIPYSAEMGSLDWQYLSQRYFPTILTKFKILHSFKDLYNNELFYYYIGYTGIKYLLIACKGSLVSDNFTKEDNVRMVRTFSEKDEIKKYIRDNHRKDLELD